MKRSARRLQAELAAANEAKARSAADAQRQAANAAAAVSAQQAADAQSRAAQAQAAAAQAEQHGPCPAETGQPPTVPTLARKSHATPFVLVQRYFARCKSFCIGSPIVPWPHPGYTLISIVEVFLDWF
jgi:nucleoid-associated protein YgaU